MPELKIELPFEVLEKLAKLASEKNEATRITAANILCAHVSRPTPVAGDGDSCDCKWNPLPGIDASGKCFACRKPRA